MICPNCGSNTDNNARFCVNCGFALSGEQPFSQAQSAPQPQIQPPPQPQTVTQIITQTPTIPPEYRPIGAWGYFGWQILFCIPVVGIILLIVFSLGGTSNINLKNFARSHFCALALVLIVIAVLLLSGVGIASLFHFTK